MFFSEGRAEALGRRLNRDFYAMQIAKIDAARRADELIRSSLMQMASLHKHGCPMMKGEVRK